NYDEAEMMKCARQMILKLSVVSDTIPSSLFLKRVFCSMERAIGRGAYADVYCGSYEEQPIALKQLRIFGDSEPSQPHKDLYREALLWRQLRHPCILPFLGLYEDTHAKDLCMVSPCMSGGSLLDFVKKFVVEVDVVNLLIDAIGGLCYLHDQSFVHGDLRAANVLIDEHGRAYLADFGLISF
ncbi:kinase-like protein, partial [Punctularia strigosozonata HHB-11173 SS5]|uniref:kinase-like protein n=1 Tax=Punctularia strigosozonata (strain HHB-11173) TaxID=741275 RepID=UPI0004417E9D